MSMRKVGKLPTKAFVPRMKTFAQSIRLLRKIVRENKKKEVPHMVDIVLRAWQRGDKATVAHACTNAVSTDDALNRYLRLRQQDGHHAIRGCSHIVCGRSVVRVI